jgi:uncharacterized protein (DUF983 family)
MPHAAPSSILEIVRRGWRRLCPRCGEGPLFESWFTLHRDCSRCGYRFERDPGETWGFWIVLDRLFLLIPLAVVAFTFTAVNWWLALLLFLASVPPLVLTMPHRWGICIGLEYLSRKAFESSGVSEKEDSP